METRDPEGQEVPQAPMPGRKDLRPEERPLRPQDFHLEAEVEAGGPEEEDEAPEEPSSEAP